MGGSYVLLNVYMDNTDWAGFAGERTLSAEDRGRFFAECELNESFTSVSKTKHFFEKVSNCVFLVGKLLFV